MTSFQLLAISGQEESELAAVRLLFCGLIADSRELSPGA
jgi:hypothetical protein